MNSRNESDNYGSDRQQYADNRNGDQRRVGGHDESYGTYGSYGGGGYGGQGNQTYGGQRERSGNDQEEQYAAPRQFRGDYERSSRPGFGSNDRYGSYRGQVIGNQGYGSGGYANRRDAWGDDVGSDQGYRSQGTNWTGNREGHSQNWQGGRGEGHSGGSFGSQGSQYGGNGQYGQQGAQHPHDPDYRNWRNEQMRTLDNDYADWRTERYGKFAEEFNNWRSSRSGSGKDSSGGVESNTSGGSKTGVTASNAESKSK